MSPSLINALLCTETFTPCSFRTGLWKRRLQIELFAVIISAFFDYFDLFVMSSEVDYGWHILELRFQFQQKAFMTIMSA